MVAKVRGPWKDRGRWRLIFRKLEETFRRSGRRNERSGAYYVRRRAFHEISRALL
jgi:hypothetical protein